MTKPKDERFETVLSFWLDDLSEADWYMGGDALDQTITTRFQSLWEEARAGKLSDWCISPRGTLAFLILTDQMPRNMFRGSAQAFATDPLALVEAKRAIDRKFDLCIPTPARQFFYLPLEHSECLCDQDRAVRMIASRMPDAPETLLHAKAHRDIIRRFGRFPFRNDALSRNTSNAEAAFIAEGGYRQTLATIRDIAA